MTEADWLACTNPWIMLHYLFCNSSNPHVREYYLHKADLLEPDGRRLDVSERKLRLLYVACCRRVWPLAPHPVLRELIEVAERFADGLTSREEHDNARKSAQAVLSNCRSARQEVDKWVARAV